MAQRRRPCEVLLALGGALERCEFGRCIVCRLAGDRRRLPARGGALVRLAFDREAFSIRLTPADAAAEEYERTRGAEAVVPIAHKTPMCPAFAFEAGNHGREDLSVRVGVAVLVESADGKILLTRRPPRLRSFGGLYVLPGGNLDRGESLVDAGLRELREETGLEIPDPSSVRPFCLWESTFPLSFDASQGDRGLTHQHLVIYIHVRASHVHSADAAPFRPQVSEISELVWVSRAEAAMLLEEAEHVEAEKPIRAFVPDEEAFDPDDWDRQVALRPERARSVPLMQLRENVVIGTQFAIRTLLGKAPGPSSHGGLEPHGGQEQGNSSL